MTSKCGKNKKVAHEALAERVTDIHMAHVFKNMFVCKLGSPDLGHTPSSLSSASVWDVS